MRTLLAAALLLGALISLAAPPDLARVHDLPKVVATLAPDTKITREALVAEMTLGGTTDLPNDRAEFLAAAGLALDAMLNRLLLVELAAAAGVVPEPASAKALFQTWRESLGEDPRVPAFTVEQERRMLRQFTDKDMIDRYVRDHVLKQHPVAQAAANAGRPRWAPPPAEAGPVVRELVAWYYFIQGNAADRQAAAKAVPAAPVTACGELLRAWAAFAAEEEAAAWAAVRRLADRCPTANLAPLAEPLRRRLPAGEPAAPSVPMVWSLLLRLTEPPP
jgi:hypothetical protein